MVDFNIIRSDVERVGGHPRPDLRWISLMLALIHVTRSTGIWMRNNFLGVMGSKGWLVVGRNLNAC